MSAYVVSPARRVNGYFITKKWNFAPAARRKADKARKSLDRAFWFLHDTHDPADVMHDDPALRDAFTIIREAQKRVAAWEDEQQRIAKEASR